MQNRWNYKLEKSIISKKQKKKREREKSPCLKNMCIYLEGPHIWLYHMDHNEEHNLNNNVLITWSSKCAIILKPDLKIYSITW